MPSLVATGHPAVSGAAVRLLEGGGNAFDAAVAAGFASAVAEPLLFGLGGGGFLLARTAAGRETLFDFFAAEPGLGRAGDGLPEIEFFPVSVRFRGAEQVFHVGRGSVAVPGMLKGLLHVHGELGRRPLADVLRPALELARDGVPATAAQVEITGLLRPILETSAEARRTYLPDGDPVPVGGLVRHPVLARFLEGLTEEPDGLYTGSAARDLERDMAAHGGLLTAEDLRRYAVVERSPLSLTYRGVRILTNPPPSVGGSLIALALGLQEAVELPGGWGSPLHARALATVLLEVERIRNTEGKPDLDGARERVRTSLLGTTHVSVADGEGGVAALTGSNGAGSGRSVPGTGVMLNNMLGEDALHPGGFHSGRPGERIASMMAPTLLVGRDGSTVAALGSGGSRRIRTAIHHVITNLVDFGLPLDEAVSRPRMHLEDGTLHLEPGWDGPALAAVRALEGPEVRVHVWLERNLYFGGVHAVAPVRGEAAGDPRRAGHGQRLA